MSFLKVKDLAKIYHYDDYSVLSDLSFEVDRGQVTTLFMGQNGGKTTLAKILVGLEGWSQGEIILEDKNLEQIPPSHRNIAFISVPSLYGKGRVEDNVAYGLIVRGMDKKNARIQALALLQEYGVDSLARAKVKDLSPLQRIKLDFARAFCRKVDLLLLDGCFGKNSDIDAFLQEEIYKRQSQGVAVLSLCDDKKYAIGRTYDFLSFFEKND